MTDDCPIIGGRCYYDGSGLQACDMLELLIREGDEAVWAEMGRRYNETLLTAATAVSTESGG